MSTAPKGHLDQILIAYESYSDSTVEKPIYTVNQARWVKNPSHAASDSFIYLAMQPGETHEEHVARRIEGIKKLQPDVGWYVTYDAVCEHSWVAYCWNTHRMMQFREPNPIAWRPLPSFKLPKIYAKRK